MEFEWTLRELMTARGMTHTTQLHDALAQLKIGLSRHQVFRLVTQRPERLSMRLLMALCEIFTCTPNELIRPVRESAKTELDFPRPPAFQPRR